jgi:gamma-glutamylcyclotransferase (GGCT)/AIG2-like uncharacterized protein YtfP
MTGFSRRPLLGPIAILEAPGRVRGSLYDFGDHPGLVLDDAGWVAGELFRIPDLAARLHDLDREEGSDSADDARSLYVRRRGAVRVDDGSSLDAWLYLYNDRWGSPGQGLRIPSGDWRAHLAARGALPG